MGDLVRIFWKGFRTGFRKGLRCYFAPLTALWLSLRRGGNYFRHVARTYRECNGFGTGEGRR